MATIVKQSASRFDPLDPDFWRDPYPYYKILRERSALYVESLNSWWVGRYEDLQAITADPATFSQAKFQEVALGEFDYEPDAAQLIASDPPVHTRLRKLAAHGFKPRRLKLLDEDIHRRIGELLDGASAMPDRRFDFMHDFADQLPVSVIADLVGAEQARCADFRRWTRDFLSASRRATMKEDELARLSKTLHDARAYFAELIDHYRGNPAENIVCDFLTAQEGDDRLTNDEIRALVILLMIGGDETTGHLMGNMLIELTENPEQHDLLRKEPHRISDAIDESLRHCAPVQTGFLFTTCDTKIGDVEIPQDSVVIAVWGSANHDERRYDNPEAFDITRKKVSHMAFGSGPHFCVGNMLAKQEAIAAFEHLFQRMPNLRVEDPDSVEWFQSYWVRGPKTLPVIY